jgi:hypothetical protein
MTAPPDPASDTPQKAWCDATARDTRATAAGGGAARLYDSDNSVREATVHGDPGRVRGDVR